MTRAFAGREPDRQGRSTRADPRADDHEASAGQGELQALADASPRVAQLSAMRTAINGGPKVAQLLALPHAARAMPMSASAPPVSTQAPFVQRYPIVFREKDDEPTVYTDSKHTWMRMLYRGDLGGQTYELTKIDGEPAGSYMIWEEEYDQYRFSPDGREIDESVRPHFMEEITGSAEIDDEEEPYSYIGEYGVGYRPKDGVRAHIEMSGMISCIGFVLGSEGAGFACHMVVGNRKPQDKATLKNQVNALAAKYEQQAGHKASYCRLLYDASTYGEAPPVWLGWLEPDGVHTTMEIVRRDLNMSILGQESETTVMWRGDPIRY